MTELEWPLADVPHEKIQGIFVRTAQLFVGDAPNCLSAMCESPIERLFGVALYVIGRIQRRVEFDDLTASFSMQQLMEFATHERRFVAAPQVKIGAYTADFLIVGFSQVCNKKKWRLLAVECDGHEFHDRTKEAAARDRKRDRTLLMGGIHTVRFTGSEIWKDALGCAMDAMALIEEQVVEDEMEFDAVACEIEDFARLAREAQKQ